MARGITVKAESPSVARQAEPRAMWLSAYITLITAVAIGVVGALIYAQVHHPSVVSPAYFQWPALLLLLGVGVLAEKFRISPHAGAEISAGFLAFFLAAAIVGPLGAIFVAVASQALVLWRAGRLQALCFSSAAAITAGGSALFYWFLLGRGPGSAIAVAGYGLAAGSLFHVLNYFVFVPVMWLRRGMRPNQVWSEGFQPFVLSHFFFLIISLGLIAIYRAYAPGDAAPGLHSTLLVVLCLLPVVGLIYAFRAYARQRDLADHNARLAARNERLALEAVASQVTALDLKDDYTAQHSAAVAQWATDIAEAMKLPQRRVHLTHLASLVHDVGKIGIPDELLKSSQSLDIEDWALIESHCVHGHKILGRIEQFEELADVVLYHHERYDGNGYPHGLVGRDIPIESRIIAVADAYSAMISRRPYGEPLPTIVAEAELEFRKGTQFDPEVVDYFLELLRGRSESYRLGMKADFRMEVQDVKFLRELPVQGEDGEWLRKPKVRESKPGKDKGTAQGDVSAREARRQARERAVYHS